METLLPSFPFEEPEETCTITITNLHGTNIGRHKKWRKMTKKEQKEEKKREKQERKKEMKELKRDLKESKLKTMKTMKEKREWSLSEEDMDTGDDMPSSNAEDSEGQREDSDYMSSTMFDSDTSVNVKVSRKGSKKDKQQMKRITDSPERERREDFIPPRPHTETITRRPRSHTDTPLPELKASMGGTDSSDSSGSYNSKRSLKPLERPVMKRTASKSFSEFFVIVAEEKKEASVQEEGKEMRRENMKKIEKEPTRRSKDKLDSSSAKEGEENKKHERIPNPIVVFSASFLDVPGKTGVQFKVTMLYVNTDLTFSVSDG